MHDGSVEAIIWHDGEAAVSANAVKSMSAADRQSLLLLLESL
ncbi:MAG TPA: di-heme oxidoredictase family protein [Acinetobacter johnsonii]|nr:di-heme oxidoredictase family protein [Acinetobacter johnsonii]